MKLLLQNKASQNYFNSSDLLDGGQNGNWKSQDECRFLNYSSKYPLIIRFQDIITIRKAVYGNYVA